MERKSRRAFRFDSLEDRVYLSVSGHSIARARAAHVRVHSVPMTGAIQLPVPMGAASVVETQGTGNVKPLGAVNITGQLTSTNDSGGGNLTLSGQRGSVNIVFNVQLPHGPHGLPTFHFNVEGGTGAYLGATGYGTMTWNIKPQPVMVFKLHGTMRSA
jgi:hypothetical protein